MELVWICFIWVVLLIVYYTWKWRKEKKKKIVVAEKRMTMSIGEILKKKHKVK